MLQESQGYDATQIAEEMTMVGEDLLAIFPNAFRTDEMAFLSLLPQLFPFPQWSRQERELMGPIARLLYVSMKLHILAESPQAQEGHRLEMAVLAGDYLSGRFTQLCVQAEAFEVFESWLQYLLELSEKLATLSLEQAPLAEKHAQHRRLLMDKILALQGLQERNKPALALAQAMGSGNWQAIDVRDLSGDLIDPEAIDRLRGLEGHAIGGNRDRDGEEAGECRPEETR